MTKESRNYIHYLEDMLESMRRIQKYTEGLSFKEFTSSTLKTDAVIRNLEIIGEASKNIPVSLKYKISRDSVAFYVWASKLHGA